MVWEGATEEVFEMRYGQRTEKMIEGPGWVSESAKEMGPL